LLIDIPPRFAQRKKPPQRAAFKGCSCVGAAYY
jgi:hypothetical protein